MPVSVSPGLMIPFHDALVSATFCPLWVKFEFHDCVIC